MSFGIPVRNGLGVGLLPSTFLSSLRIGGRPAMFLNFVGTTTLDSRITFTRATTATFVGSNGLIQTAAINTPCFDYDPVTLAPKGLLVWEQRTNNALYSEQFDNAAWTKVATTVSANATISPDGATTGDKLVEDAATSIHRVAQSFATTANAAVSYTVYAKADTRRYLSLGMGGLNGVVATFDLQTGVISGAATALGTGWSTATAVITPAGNGWYRCALSGVDTAGASRPFSISLNNVSTNPINAQGNSYAGDNTSGLFLWGAQIETGAFATSYIPTVAATISRSADVAQMTNTNFSSWYNQSAGTFIASADCPALGSRTVFSADDATTSNLMRVRSAVAEPFFIVNAGGVNQASLDGGTITANTIYTQAAAYAANDFATSVNGGAAVTDASGSVPTVSRLSIGADPSGNYLNGHIRTINYYNTRLSNDTIQSLTV